MRIYTIYDLKVQEYGNLVLAANDATVVRALRDGLPPNTTEAKYPQDFNLMYMGTYHTHTGIIVGADGPQFVSSLEAILRPEERNA